MTTSICFIDERDVETDFSLAVMALPGWPGNLGSSARDVPLLEGPEMHGALIDPRLIRQRPGRASIVAIMDTASLDATRTALDALRGLLGGGEVRVRTVFAPDRYCLAVLEALDGDLFTPGLLNGSTTVTLTFAVKDGVAFRTQPDGYALSATALTACPIGTAPSYPYIRIHGGGASLTDPLIIIANGSGDDVQWMGFTGTLAAAASLRVDCARTTISTSVEGVVTAAESMWNGVGDFPVLRPADGWPENAVYPTMKLWAASGTPHGVVSYSRAYR